MPHHMIGNIVLMWTLNGLAIIKYRQYEKFVTTSNIIWADEYLSKPINHIAENNKYMYVIGVCNNAF